MASVYSDRFGKRYVLASTPELHHFYLAEARPDVWDLDSQVQMDHDAYDEIARKLGGHRFPRNRIGPTSDLVLYLRASRRPFAEVWSVKRWAALADPNVRLNLGIEEEYWSAKGFRWCLRTERDVPEVELANLWYIRAFRHPDSWLPKVAREERILLLAGLYERLMDAAHTPLAATCLGFDHDTGHPRGTSAAGCRFALANSLWPADLSVPIDPELPPSFLTTGAI